MRHVALLVVLAGCAPDRGVDGAPPDATPPGPRTGDPVALNADGPALELAPTAERTVCRSRRYALPDGMTVTRITADLGPGSHHLILYLADELVTEEPVPCAPFDETFSGARRRPLAIAEKAHDELVFPPGVGYRLGRNPVLTVEAHTINATAQPLAWRGAFRLEGVAGAAAGLTEANLAFWGTTNIRIPPRSRGDSGLRFQRGYTDTRAFALTTHTHRLGTRVRVWASRRSGDTARLVAETTDWESPPLVRLEPPVGFDGTSGLSWRCEWDNPTDRAVGFGESALDEMCFVWHYYVPSRGFDFCVDGTCLLIP